MVFIKFSFLKKEQRKKNVLNNIHMCVRERGCICLFNREREREREKGGGGER